jgi:hypothetical protein
MNNVAIVQISQAQEENFAALKGLIASNAVLTESQTESLVLLEAGMNANDLALSHAIRNVTRDAKSSREAMAAKFVSSISDLGADVRFNLKSVKTLAGTVTDGQSDVETRRRFAIMIQNTIETLKAFPLSPTSTDYEFVPFTRFAGIKGHVEGDELYEKYSYFPMEAIRIVHRGWDISQQSLDETRVYEDTYTLNCKTDDVVGKTAFAYDWEDIISSIGPEDCTPQNDPNIIGGTGVACGCFIERQRFYCDVTNKTVFEHNPDILDNFGTFAALGATNLEGCSAAVEDTSIPETTIRTTPDLYAALYEVCLIGDYDNGYNIQSMVLGSDAVDIDTLHGLACAQPQTGIDDRTTIEKETIVQTLVNDIDTINIVTGFFNTIVLAKDLQYLRDVEWEHNHWGQIPKDVDFVTVPFNDGNDEQGYSTGASKYATIVFTAPTDPLTSQPASYIPVYNFENVRISSSISVTVDGVTTTSTDIQTTDKWSNILVPQMVFFGNPYKIIGSGLTRFVFDVRDPSISRTARQREGDVTYMMIHADEGDPEYVPEERFHDINSWLEENPTERFNAAAATNSLHLHARTIVQDPTVPDGNKFSCVESRVEDGILCQMLEHYRVDAPLDTFEGLDTKLIFTADEFVTQGTIDVPIGEIVINIVSDCLSVLPSLEVSANLFTKRVSLNNPTGSQSEVCVHTYNPNNPLDSECNRYTTVSVPAGSTATLAFPRCTENTTVSNDLEIRQYLLDTDAGCSATTILTQTSCSDAGIVVASGDDEIVSSNIPQVAAIREEAYIIDDIQSVSQAALAEYVSQLALEMHKYNRIFEVATGVDLGTISFVDTSAVLGIANGTLKLAADFREDLQVAASDAFNSTNYVTGYAELQANVDAFQMIIDSIASVISVSIDNLDIQNTILANITAELQILRDEDLQAYTDVLNGVTNILSKIADIGNIERLDPVSFSSPLGKLLASVINGAIDLVEAALDLTDGLFDGLDGFIDGLLDMFLYLAFFGVIGVAAYIGIKILINKCGGKKGYSSLDANAMKEMQRDIRELQVEFGKIRDDLDDLKDSIAELGRTMKQLNITKYKQSFSLAKKV